MSDEIDKDAIEVLGINPKIWKEYRGMTDPKYVQDDKDAFERHKLAMAKRWFGYYRKCQDQKKKASIIDQYNMIAIQKQRG